MNLARILPLMRILAAAGVMAFSLFGQWQSAFFVLLLAWTTVLLEVQFDERLRLTSGYRPFREAATTILGFTVALVPVGYAAGHHHAIIAAFLGGIYGAMAIAAFVRHYGLPVTELLDRFSFITGRLVAPLVWFAYMAFALPGVVPVLFVLGLVATMYRLSSAEAA